jgi:F-type H+-transporting ATPase subunit delta
MATAIANRYARALADVVGPAGDPERTLGELEAFRAVYRESSELREVLESPGISFVSRLRVLDAILARLGTSLAAANFLRVLTQNFRMRLLDEVCEGFRRVAYDRLGIVEVKISSSAELPPDEREALRARFTALTGRQVVLEFQVEPELVGGLRAQVASTVYDGSIRGALDRLEQQLMAR